MAVHEETTQNFVPSGQYSMGAQAVHDRQMDRSKKGRRDERKEGR